MGAVAMKRLSRTFGPVVFLLLAVLCLPSRATNTKSTQTIAAFAKYLQIPGAKPVGSDTCTGCHEAVGKDFRHAFHAQQGVECEDCHGAGSLHVEGGGDVTKIVAFSKRSPVEANGVCLSCHAQGEKLRHWISGSHAVNHLRCMDCHQVHQAAFKAANQSQLSFDRATKASFTAASLSPETNNVVRPRWQTDEACLKCHPTENAQLSMPYHHPLREGKMSCIDCHDPHGGPDGRNLKTADKNQLCLSCHAQYRGPFAYQHPPVTENCLICHTVHGSPNTNLLLVSEPALCLQCHAGHHNGASLPISDRCTNCHSSIHGTDIATPSGGSRFIDKGPYGVPSEPPQPVQSSSATSAAALNATHGTLLRPTYSGMLAGGVTSSLSALAPMAGANMPDPSGGQEPTEIGAIYSAYSLTPASYRFVDGTGFLGRVAEYDTLQQSAGADAATSYVDPRRHLTAVFRGNLITGDDYSATSQVTVGQWFQAFVDLRSFMQQQDHYNSYLPVLSSDFATPGANTDTIPANADFATKRRFGDAYGRFKVPKVPIHLFVKGNWQARVGETQLTYLDENTTAAVYVTNPTPPPALTNSTCGQLCHFSSQFQPVNYTTRNVGGGAEVDLGQLRLTWEHIFSSFNDRLAFPIGNYTGPFTTENEGFSPVNPPVPPATCPRCSPGPTPLDVAAGNYYLNDVPPSQSSTDTLRASWIGSPQLTFNGQLSYTRLVNTFTDNPQRVLDTDNTVNWHPIDRLRLTADYHQQNLINQFVPYYSLYGDVSYHHHWEGLRADYQLPKGFDVEPYYQHSSITRSNAFLWPQVYSFDNTDLLTVVPSSESNTGGLALRYHDNNYWSARAGYEFTSTQNPGYLLVPQSNNRAFADVWLTPTKWLVLSNDFSVIVQNAFPAIPLLRSDGTGDAGVFQRRNRFYYETLSATLRPLPDWTIGLGYSYQQNNLNTYMAFQNDSSVGYVINEPLVPYKQITQAYWGETSYTARQRLGLNLRVTYNSSRSGIRPDVNPNNAAQLGNASLISQGIFDPNALFPSALGNLALTSTQISQVIVPQWIGQGKVYYLFPRKFEGGFIFYYGSYRDYWNPNLNGVFRTATIYVGRSW